MDNAVVALIGVEELSIVEKVCVDAGLSNEKCVADKAMCGVKLWLE